MNDTLGHQAGDKLLIETAEILKKNFRSGDVVCRLGGDEFLLFSPCNDPSMILQTKLEQIRMELERDVDTQVHVSCSMGVTLAPKDGTNFDELYKHADEALYIAKERGRNGYAFYAD